MIVSAFPDKNSCPHTSHFKNPSGRVHYYTGGFVTVLKSLPAGPANVLSMSATWLSPSFQFCDVFLSPLRNKINFSASANYRTVNWLCACAKLQTFLVMNRVLTRNPVITLKIGLPYLEGLLSVNPSIQFNVISWHSVFSNSQFAANCQFAIRYWQYGGKRWQWHLVVTGTGTYQKAPFFVSPTI